MEKFNVYAARTIEQREFFAPGHKACSGCIPALTLRLLLKGLGPDIVISQATGCMEIISSAYPETSWRVPWLHVAFETSASVAAGMEAGIVALKKKGKLPKDKPIKVLALGGDGGTADIGLQALSGALERGHEMIYVCYDNEAYMNTGIQRSGMTPFCAWTTTSPSGKVSRGQNTRKKDLFEIAVAHHIPYAATGTAAYPFDMLEKVRKAKLTKGPVFLHLFATCPVGWRANSKDGIKLLRLAVESGVFPMIEVVNGYYRFTYEPKKLISIRDYIKTQGRFRHLSDQDIEEIQAYVVDEYNRIKRKCDQDKEYFEKMPKENVYIPYEEKMKKAAMV